jgi:GcrA cell cycle regulator
MEVPAGYGMQLGEWEPEQCNALREYFARGMSFLQIAKAINAKFKTTHSRSAVIGRARRMGLAGRARPGDRPKHWPARPPKAKAKAPRPKKPRTRHVPEPSQPVPVLKRAGPARLRCVEIAPRHLLLVELEAGDCRYPYGGDEDGEAITFCGHPRREGSSYCAPHFHLTRGAGAAPERTSGTAPLRLVEAA